MDQKNPENVITYATAVGFDYDMMASDCHHMLGDSLSREDIIELVTEDRRNAAFVALDSEENALGYIIFSRPENSKTIEIVGLGLRDPENQNSTHIATELIDRVMSLTSPRRPTLKVEFPDSYDATIKLFKNLGFKPICKKDTMYFTSEQEPYLERLTERFKAATGVEWEVSITDDCETDSDKRPDNQYTYRIVSKAPLSNGAKFIAGFYKQLGEWDQDRVGLVADDTKVTIRISNARYEPIPQTIALVDHYMQKANEEMSKTAPNPILTTDSPPNPNKPNEMEPPQIGGAG